MKSQRTDEDDRHVLVTGFIEHRPQVCGVIGMRVQSRVPRQHDLQGNGQLSSDFEGDPEEGVQESAMVKLLEEAGVHLGTDFVKGSVRRRDIDRLYGERRSSREITDERDRASADGFGERLCQECSQLVPGGAVGKQLLRERFDCDEFSDWLLDQRGPFGRAVDAFVR